MKADGFLELLLLKSRNFVDKLVKFYYNINIRFNSMLKGKAQKPEKGKI